MFGDQRIAVDGWTVDDVRLFACGGTRPANLAALSSRAGANKVTVTWKEPLYAGGGSTGYRVDRNNAAAVHVSRRTRSYTFTKLRPGKSYTVTVTPIAKGGAGPTSARVVNAK